jgi:hypothetical protein
MSKQVPSEILHFIAFYLPYEKGISLSPYLNLQLNHGDGVVEDYHSFDPYNNWSIGLLWKYFQDQMDAFS